MRYNPKKIEAKWQKVWEDNQTYVAQDGAGAKKSYLLVEFPYPSGEGLHVGHPRSYTAMDVLARKRRMEGENVLFPIGFDAFGLPAENYAIKTGQPPAVITKKNIENFRRQLKSLGLSLDWSREVVTSDPNYYKWTQWIFLQLYKHGLAYKGKSVINWCPKDKIGLANEEVVGGKCERCGNEVEQREKEQWMLKITAYADKLLEGLQGLDWISRVVDMQENWIGRSEGAEVRFSLANVPGQEDNKHSVDVFTTRLDTIFGATFLVISPELAKKWLEVGWQADKTVTAYIEEALSKRELERMESAAKDKTGVDTGLKAINPATQAEIPVWVADYVLGSYGTGAIMAVPAHDERDFLFARKFSLPIVCVVEPANKVRGVGILIEKSDSTIVLHRRDQKTKRDPDMLTPFGGAVEKNESPRDAAVRELKEELGLSVSQEDLVQIGIFSSLNTPGEEIAMYVYKVDNGQKILLGEGAGVEALTVGAALKSSEVTEFTKKILRSLGSASDIFIDKGVLISSGVFTGMDSEEAKVNITKEIGATTKVQYKLRDWVFSRQRYWGEPIPMVKCPTCGWVPLPESALPLVLPPVEKYQPTDTGESPLAQLKDWVETICPNCGGKAERETDTMPNWAGSSWYYLRYADPHNDQAFADKEKLKYWLPVDWYNGGMEHTTLHLLYSRFWHKFLYDIGEVPTPEPYMKRTSHGMVLAQDGQKMSKSRGNVVNPDDVVATFGADTMRTYELFMGPFADAIPWSTDSIAGVRRFLERVWHITLEPTEKKSRPATQEEERELAHQIARVTQKVTDGIEAFRFNTSVSYMMEFINYLYSVRGVALDKKTEALEIFLQLLHPFAPHLTAELWESKFPNADFIWEKTWPKYNMGDLERETHTWAIQVNGKLRATIISSPISEETLVSIAKKNPNVEKWLADKEILKTIVIPKRLVNFVVKE